VHNNFIENDSSMVHQCDSARTAGDTKVEKSSIVGARRHKHTTRWFQVKTGKFLPSNPTVEMARIKRNQQLAVLVVQAVLLYA